MICHELKEKDNINRNLQFGTLFAIQNNVYILNSFRCISFGNARTFNMRYLM